VIDDHKCTPLVFSARYHPFDGFYAGASMPRSFLLRNSKNFWAFIEPNALVPWKLPPVYRENSRTLNPSVPGKAEGGIRPESASSLNQNPGGPTGAGFLFSFILYIGHFPWGFRFF
jgi:hypothetical protein